MMRVFEAPVQWLFSTTGSLTQRAARAGLWLAMGDVCGRLAGIAKLVILARLLSPADFGIIALAVLVTTWVDHFTEPGFNSALIHQRGDIRPYLDTAWTAQLLRTLALGCVIAATAPAVAWIFAEPYLVPVLRVLAIETVIHGFKNPAVVYFRKDLDTRREMVWTTSAVLAGLLVGIPAAFVFKNVWALVASLLASAITGTAMSYWVHPYRPSLQVEWSKLRELARFGRWVLCFRIVSLFTASLDAVVLGRVVGSAGLGFYQMASQVTAVPVSTIGVHLHGVMFPAFAKIDDDDHRRRALLRVLGLVLTIVVPIGFFLTVFGGFVATLALGPAWHGIERLVEVLAWVGVMRAIMCVISAFLLAAGRPDLDFRSSLPKLLVLALGLYPATVAYGTIGAALVVIAGTAAAFVYQITLILSVVHFSMRDVRRQFRGPVLASLPFAGAWVALSTWTLPVLLIGAAATAISVGVVATSIHAAVSSRGSAQPLTAGS